MELKDDDLYHCHTRIAYALELSRVLPSSGEFLVAAGSCLRPTTKFNVQLEMLNLALSGTSYSPIYYAVIPTNICFTNMSLETGAQAIREGMWERVKVQV